MRWLGQMGHRPRRWCGPNTPIVSESLVLRRRAERRHRNLTARSSRTTCLDGGTPATIEPQLDPAFEHVRHRTQ
jgi:hypothetical protein